MKKISALIAMVCGVWASLFATGISETKFPTRQITIICQANPGGSSDLNCRTIAPGISESLEVPVTVENRPGAGGGVGISYGAAAAPDGYTIVHLPNDIAQIKPAGNADVTPDDFRFLCRVVTHPASIAVLKNSPYKNFNDFIVAAKTKPGKISVGNSGTGAVWHLAASQLEQVCGATFNHIPFEGAAPAITAVMGGHIDSICASAAEVRSYVQNGDLRLLIVMSDEKFGLFPDVPTAKDLGYDINIQAWLAFGVPKNTPDDIFSILYNAMKKSYKSDTYQKMLRQNGFVPGWMEPAEIQKFARDEYEVYRKLIPRVLGYKEVPPLK